MFSLSPSSFSQTLQKETDKRTRDVYEHVSNVPGAGNSAVSQNLHLCSILTRNNKNFQRRGTDQGKATGLPGHKLQEGASGRQRWVT